MRKRYRDLSRRSFLRAAAAFGCGAAGLAGLPGCGGNAAVRHDPSLPGRFGELQEDPAGILDLPAGFHYQIASMAGDLMDDGFLVPALADGMAAFPGTGAPPPDGRTIVVRNHEVNLGDSPRRGAFGAGNELVSKLAAGSLYDPGTDPGLPCLGGTTTLVYDTRFQVVEKVFLSLGGTLRNCAGGRTPWGSWLSCEETTDRAGGLASKDHGYVFEVPAVETPGLADPVALVAMGRFNHEAVAVDPTTGVVYMTEDRGDGVVYRFLPDVPGELFRGGRLQALSVVGSPSLDTRNRLAPRVSPGVPLAVAWIDLDEIDSPSDDLRHRAVAAGAAVFARGEGMWYGLDAVYFVSTNGGAAEKGQIWKYVPSPAEGTAAETSQPGQLELFVEAQSGSILENGDNIAGTPWGDLIVAEDGPGEQYLVGVTPSGELYTIARNALSSSEFAGPTFSPDGTTLFVNLQHDGLTLAVTGPWTGP